MVLPNPASGRTYEYFERRHPPIWRCEPQPTSRIHARDGSDGIPDPSKGTKARVARQVNNTLIRERGGAGTVGFAHRPQTVAIDNGRKIHWIPSASPGQCSCHSGLENPVLILYTKAQGTPPAHAISHRRYRHTVTAHPPPSSHPSAPSKRLVVWPSLTGFLMTSILALG